MRKLIFASALLAAGTFGAHAADLAIEPAPMAPAPASTSIYVQLLGGVALGLDASFAQVSAVDYETDAGWAAGATLGVVVMDGLSIEADVFATNREFTDGDEPGENLDTVSFMGNVKYTAPVSDTISIYGAAGLGMLWYSDNFSTYSNTYSGLGYQLVGGVAVALTDNISLVGELRYQDTFESAVNDDDDSYTADIPVAAAVVGLKLAM